MPQSRCFLSYVICALRRENIFLRRTEIMSYPVTVLEDGKKMQIGGWVYTVKELKASWKLSYDMGNMEVVVNVPKATAADVNELQAKLQEKF